MASTLRNIGILRFSSSPRPMPAPCGVLRLIGLAGVLMLSTASLAFGQVVISQANWRLHSVDSQETASGNYAATNAFDGNPATFWSTQFTGAKPPTPHEIQIDLGVSYSVRGFRYLPRQDGSDPGRIGQYQFYVSSNGSSWGSAVASGTFPNTASEQVVNFSAKTGRYIRLRATTEVAGRPYTTVAEINVLATGNQPPNGVINSPAGNVTIPPGQSINFSGTGTDPDNNLPLTYSWTFGSGGPSSSTSQNPVVVFPKVGVYTVTFTVRDSQNRTDPVPATRTVTVQAGAPGAISQTNWTLHSVDSQETAGGNYAATNAFDGNGATMWTTQWQSASPPPPHDIRINLGSPYSVTGFRYLPRQDGSAIGRIAQYEFYVSEDGANWGTAVASGTFANTAAEQQVQFTAKTGAYVRLRALSEVAGLPYTAVAEINVLGTGNQPPNGVMTAPTGNPTIAPGQSVTFTGTGTDPDNHLPLTYSWNFGTGGPASSTSQNPGAVTFPTVGVYTVTFTVRDAQGKPDPTPVTRTVTVQSSSSAALLPQSGWTLRFADSEETDAESGFGTNAFDGNPNSAWVTKWFNGGPPPPHEIQINLGALHEVTGFRYLPIQSFQAGRVGDYEFYVSVDGNDWGTPVAVGTFPDTNSSAARDVFFTPKSGSYVRFRALSEVNNGDFIFSAISELNVWRSGAGANQAPTPTMSSPAGNLTLVAGNAVTLSGSGSDPDGNLPLTYRWSIGPASGIANLDGSQPGVAQFDRSGTFTATLNVTDALGKTASVSRTITVVAGTPISTSGWALRFADSQDTANGNLATGAFDGNPNTMWVTEWVAAQPPPPHEIQVDLGATRDVRGFRYLPRQDGSSVGNIGKYRFYVSSDGLNWGVPVASGIFDGSSSEKEVATRPASGRYVRLQALSEVNGFPYTVVAELRVLSPACQGPSVTLAQPIPGDVQTATTLTVRADACVTSGQGVRFVVNGGPGSGGAQSDDTTAPYSVNVSGLTKREHLIEALLIAQGNPVSGPANYDQAVRVGIGDYYVAMGEGMTLGYGDDQPGDDNSADGRNMLGGFTPILADALTSAKGYPVKVANEGVGSTASLEGLASIQTLLQKHPNAQSFLVMYGHTDAADGVPTGLGLGPGQAGYAGSFKDRIQQIINAVKAAGKTVFLAKAPPVLPVNGSIDSVVQQYNMVMDELAAIPSNSISKPPTDFYSYFLSRTNTEYQDTILLNGLGYQSMAQLWLQVLR